MNPTIIFYTNLLNRAVSKMSERAAIVIGPIFAGESKEENLKIFHKEIERLSSEGVHVFNQIPFLDENLVEQAPFDYKTKFSIFYKGLFESGKIQKVYVLPGWEDSEGTQQEMTFAKEQGIEIEFL